MVIRGGHWRISIIEDRLQDCLNQIRKVRAKDREGRVLETGDCRTLGAMMYDVCEARSQNIYTTRFPDWGRQGIGKYAQKQRFLTTFRARASE